MREVRVKNFEEGHYRLRWIEAGKATRVLPRELLGYHIKVLEAPVLEVTISKQIWSQREKSALVARRKAGERYKSIALSFGRSEQSVRRLGTGILRDIVNK